MSHGFILCFPNHSLVLSVSRGLLLLFRGPRLEQTASKYKPNCKAFTASEHQVNLKQLERASQVPRQTGTFFRTNG